MHEVNLPSGSILKIHHTPFEISLVLHDACCEEAKQLNFTSQTEVATLWKDLYCYSFSSKRIKEALWKCFEHCTYNNLKIDKDTFDPIEARQDYQIVCEEVAKYNVLPFVKARSAVLSVIQEILKPSQGLKSKMTPS